MSRTGSNSEESIFPSEEIPKLKADFVAAGSYGCVVKPALPNVNVTANDPSWTYYDTNVTKLYSHRGNLKKAIKDAKRIYKITDNDGHVVYPYKFEGYKGKHLKPATLEACALPPTKFLNPLRMPNLGYSIHDLKRGRHAELTSLRKIPAGIIFKQILKCIKQVYTFHKKGYIHGDLRTTNIMVEPKTGAITIIDFDWLNPTDHFFREYKPNLGYYNNPAECLLPDAYNALKSGETIESFIKEVVHEDYSLEERAEKFITKFEEYIRYTRNMHEYRLQSKFKLTEEELVKALLKSSKLIEEKLKSSKEVYRDFYKMVEPTFDAYGLCFSLLELIYLIDPSVFFPKTKDGIERFAERTLTTQPVAEHVFDTLQEFIEHVLVPCTSLTLQDRLPIDGAYEKAKAIFEKFDSRIGATEEVPMTRKSKSSRSPSASRSRARTPGFGSPRPTKRVKRNTTGGSRRRPRV